jgi:lipopolysaccharide/colanic/teichoic acid biosynthesis glycosyltransferase
LISSEGRIQLYKKFIKRLIDIVFAIILMPIVLPIIAICGAFIKLEDRGPVFYFGERLGKDRKVFKMFKLRSMKVNAPDLRNEDGSTFNADDDLRLTKMGRFVRKTSLDEIPQIINVLIGDMSFLGPRPDLPEHINYYEGNDIRKLEVLPGISGYNQAYYRNSAEWKDRLKHDVYYVDNISIWMDIKILFKTIESIIFKKGIYANSQSNYVKGNDKNERYFKA